VSHTSVAHGVVVASIEVFFHVHSFRLALCDLGDPGWTHVDKVGQNFVDVCQNSACRSLDVRFSLTRPTQQLRKLRVTQAAARLLRVCES